MIKSFIARRLGTLGALAAPHLVTLCAIALPTPALAQPWPDRPVRLVVP